MPDEAVTCPFCASRNVRATLPATAQFFEYRCRDCRRNWFTGSLGTGPNDTTPPHPPSIRNVTKRDREDG